MNEATLMIEDHIIDKNIPIPLYYQLKMIIYSEIEKGNYAPGALIPTEEELIAHFGISRTTVRQAITELVQDGRLYRVKSKGTFVAQNKINQDFIVRLESFNDQIRKSGRIPSTEVLDFKLGVAPFNVSEALKLGPNDPIIFLQRRRFADGAPILSLKTYLPTNRCSFVMGHDFATESLYKVLEDHDPACKVHYVRRIVEAIRAPQAIAKYLHIKTGDPVLFFTSTGYTADDIPIEYSRAYYRADCNKFEITVMA